MHHNNIIPLPARDRQRPQQTAATSAALAEIQDIITRQLATEGALAAALDLVHACDALARVSPALAARLDQAVEVLQAFSLYAEFETAALSRRRSDLEAEYGIKRDYSPALQAAMAAIRSPHPQDCA